MNNEVIQPNKPRMTWVQVLVGVTAFSLLASLMMPLLSHPAARGNITKGISNCRQINQALHLYAEDHDGKYPDAALTNPKSANEVFRVLFKEETIDAKYAEKIFGCPLSPFNPDGAIGVGNDHREALEAGENHWAMTKGLTVHNAGNIPLVYENPVNATWPPVWNPDAKGSPVRGRAWSAGIIVGLNDGSAQIHPLASKKGKAVPLKKYFFDDSNPQMNLFEQAIDTKEFPKGEVLDIEVKP